MEYITNIQSRKSTRAFQEKAVPEAVRQEIAAYARSSAKRLIPEIRTELREFGADAKAQLEGAAGYREFMIGAPYYYVLLSEDDPRAGLNAGFLMEDIVLQLTDRDLATCWITFDDPAAVKKALQIDSDLKPAAIIAFGYGQKVRKKIHLNIHTMSNIDITTQRQYFAEKKDLRDLVFLGTWGNREGVEEHIGFYDDILYTAFKCSQHAPSYLNRQPYGFVLDGQRVVLVSEPDPDTDPIDRDLNLGVVMLHFTVAAEQYLGPRTWTLNPEAGSLQLPEGYTAVAACNI